jgi:hypothetical protein
MKQEEKQLAIVAVEMIIKYGVPAFIGGIRSLRTNNPTVAEIRALRDTIKAPEEYFNDQPGQGGEGDEKGN